MNPDLTSQLHAWHDFYAATAGVSATLLGLLFVSLALNPRILRSWRSPALRIWAGQTFHNFLVALFISLTALIPERSATGLYIPLAILGGQGIYRVISDRIKAARDTDPRWHGLSRLGWTISLLAAYGTCLWVAVDLYLGIYESFDWLVLPISILLTSAAASCLDLLAEIGSIGDDPPDAPPENPPASNAANTAGGS